MTYDRMSIESPAVDELVKVLGSCSGEDMRCNMMRMQTVTSSAILPPLLACSRQDVVFANSSFMRV
jgi:hypothetical protein